MRGAGSAAVLLVAFGVLLARAEDGRIARVVEVVRATDATPVGDAVVEAWGLPDGPVTKRTGEDGTARFDGMPRKGVVFVARLDGCLCGWHEPGRWWWTVPEEDADPDGDGVTRMRLRLVAGSVVEGRVLSRDGERPIAGAVVEAREVAHATDLWTLRGAPLWQATTDAEGRFLTTGHWPARPDAGDKDKGLVSAVVTARAAGWAHEETELWPAGAGRPTPLRFRLLPAGEIPGTVADADGTPAGGVLVHAYPPGFFGPDRDGNGTEAREMHVRTDAKGAFTLPEAAPGVPYVLFAERTAPDPDGIGDAVIARSALASGVRAGAAGTRLALRRLGSLTVRVVPKASRVEVVPPPDARPWAHDFDRDGVVTVPEADPGPWTIEADARGWVFERVVAQVEAGKPTAVTVRLSRGSAVTGVVVDDAGHPVAGAAVYAYNLDPGDPDRYLDGYEEARTGEDGRFRLRGLRAGPTDLSVRHERLRSDESVRVEAPADGVRLVLHATASVRIRLRVPAPPERVRVTVTRLDGPRAGMQSQSVVERAGGGYTVAHLMPGLVDLAVEARGYAPYVARLTIRPGAVHEPEPLALSEGVALRGRVVDGSGRGVAGARVLAWGNEDNAVRSAQDGTFEVPHLAPGPVDLAVMADGMAMVLLTTRIAADGAPVTVVLRPGGLVRGTLRGQAWNSVDFFPAAAKDDNVSRWRAPVEAGAFSIRLPAGRYRCAFPRADATRGPATFDVAEGGEVVLDLVAR